jgi:polyhydroxybutyrate depolymerase
LLLSWLVACDPRSLFGSVPSPAPAPAEAPASPAERVTRPGGRADRAPPEADEDPEVRSGLADGRTKVVDLPFEGRTRRYRVVPPDRYDDKRAWPVLLGFHGGGPQNTGAKMEANWVRERGSDVFLVFPDGENGGWYTIGEGGPNADTDPLRDVRFAEAVVDDLAKTYHVDRERVYAAGFSNGAMLVWSMLCAEPAKFAGFAMVASGMTGRTLEKCAPGAAERPVFYAHGTGDFLFAGNTLQDRGMPVASAHDTLAKLRQVYSCKGDPRPDALPTRCQNGRSTTKKEFDQCAGQGRVEYFEIANGTHSWPGGRGGACSDLDASAEILRWFGPP